MMDVTVHTGTESCQTTHGRILDYHYKLKKKAEDCVKTIVEATTHTVPTVDGCNYVGFDFAAVNDLCRLSSLLKP